MKRLRVFLKRLARRLFRQKDTPQSIAWGTALGCFVAMTPTVGFQMVIGIAVATVFRVNRLCAAAMAWISNPLTIPAILYFQYRLGALILPGGDGTIVDNRLDELSKAAKNFSFLHVWESTGLVFGALANLGGEILWPLLLGSFISGVVLAVIAYPFALHLALAVRRRSEARAAAWSKERETSGAGRESPENGVAEDAGETESGGKETATSTDTDGAAAEASAQE